MSMPLADAGHWVTVWAASAQAAYPVGSTIAQPDLRAAVPDAAQGLVNQSLRMLLRPALWSTRFRLRLSSHFGDRPVQLRRMSLALHQGGGAVVGHAPSTAGNGPYGKTHISESVCIDI